MDTGELRGLMEAYSEVYAPQEVDEAVKGADPEMRRAASAERRGGDRPLPRKEGEKNAAHMARKIRFSDKVTKAKGHIPGYAYAEEVDKFDLVLGFLQVEGFAETLEEAEWMMANLLDKETIDIIVEAMHEDEDEEDEKEMKKGKKNKKDDEEEGEEEDDELSEASYSAKAARAGKDIGKPGKAFAKIAASAGKRYGSKERGEKVAGAVLAKLRAKRG